MQNSSISPQEAKAELARRELSRRHLLPFIKYNFPGYKEGWHHRVLCDALERVEKGECKRLMVFMPPRHGKSEIISVQFPAWLIGRNKDRNIIEASYSSDLSTDFGRQARNIIASNTYRNVFAGVELSEDSKAKGKWNTNGRGAYNAAGVGGAVTGKGADFLIIDDPVKNRQDADSVTIRETAWSWYRSTARTRLSPNGAIILVMTRWHDDDLAARILANDTESRWEVISFPAIATEDEEHRKKGEPLWPEHFTAQNLDEIRNDLGSYEWSALYQQEPIDEQSALFKREFFRPTTFEEVRKKRVACFITIDTPSPKEFADRGGDYFGFCVNFVDEQNFWHIKAWREHMGPTAFVTKLLDLYQWTVDLGCPATMAWEDMGFTRGLEGQVRDAMRTRNLFFGLHWLTPDGRKKEERIRTALLGRYESRTVFHIEGECKDLEDELIRYPKAKNDDCSDATAYQADIAHAPFAITDKPYEGQNPFRVNTAPKEVEEYEPQYSEIGI